jgi:hypothetical protein
MLALSTDTSLSMMLWKSTEEPKPEKVMEGW